jgi:hypothetical protein
VLCRALFGVWAVAGRFPKSKPRIGGVSSTASPTGEPMGSSFLRSTPQWVIVVLVVFVLHPGLNYLTQHATAWQGDRLWEDGKPRLAQDLKTLDPVLHALEQYQIDHRVKGEFTARYPATLQDLVPRYLKALPPLPPALHKLQYKQIIAKQSFVPLPPPALGGSRSPYDPVSCQIIIPLRASSVWGQLLGSGPRGTLLYHGVNWSMGPYVPGGVPFGLPYDRLAGWDYYSPYHRSFGGNPPKLNQHEVAKRPYREERLQVLQPLSDALQRYWQDHVERPDHPPTHPDSLQALVPHYLPALPKLPEVFGPLHYDKTSDHAWVWVRLNEQVVDPKGKPIDVSGTMLYHVDAGSPEIILDQSDPGSRPVRWVDSVGGWAVYD